MRIVGTFLCPSLKELDPSLLQSLNLLVPEAARKSYGFTILRSPNLALVESAVMLVEAHGWRTYGPQERVRRHDRVYSVHYEREYDPIDYEQVDFLRFVTGPMIESPGRDERGCVQVDMLHSAIQEHQLISGGERGCDMLVADPVKVSLERAGLKDISFRETVFIDVRDVEKLRLPWDFWKRRWWEVVGGDLVLPPLSTRQTIVDIRTREPLPRGSERPCLPLDLDDSRIVNGELYYDRSDFQGVDSFDFAHTHERIGFDHAVIVSQRFFQAVKAGGDIGWWSPVHLE